MPSAIENPEAMATLKCPFCRLNLYMPMRTLHQSWSCPNCRKTSKDIRTFPELAYFELELQLR